MDNTASFYSSAEMLRVKLCRLPNAVTSLPIVYTARDRPYSRRIFNPIRAQIFSVKGLPPISHPHHSTTASPTTAAMNANDPSPGSIAQSDFHCVSAGEGVAFSTTGDWEKEVTGKAPSYTEPLFRPDVAKTIEEEMDNLSDELRELSLKIHGTSIGSKLLLADATDAQ